jgi:iron complex transport system ATP-binding protein
MLAARQIHFDYDGRPALRGVSVEADPGSILGVIGPNGSGKSTLLKCLGGLLRPRQGEVFLGGRRLTEYRPIERARLLAAVPQDVEATLPFTCMQVVLMGRMPFLGRWGRPSGADKAVAEWAMAAAACSHLGDRAVTELSGGERQGVFLAKALAQTPTVLILDEPTQHLDLGHQVAWFTLLEKVARERRMAIVAALHEVNLAVEFCHRLVLLVDGVVVAQGSVREVARAENISQAYAVRLFLPAREVEGPA